MDTTNIRQITTQLDNIASSVEILKNMIHNTHISSGIDRSDISRFKQRKTRHGNEKIYYTTDGDVGLFIDCWYVDDTLDGPYDEYRRDGSKLFSCLYVKGAIHGFARTYDVSGDIATLALYDNGRTVYQ